LFNLEFAVQLRCYSPRAMLFRIVAYCANTLRDPAGKVMLRAMKYRPGGKEYSFLFHRPGTRDRGDRSS